MKFNIRLINKKMPTLLLKKDNKLKSNIEYLFWFPSINSEIKINSFLRRFNNDYFSLEMRKKAMGAIGLKYNENYEIEIEEYSKWKNKNETK